MDQDSHKVKRKKEEGDSRRKEGRREGGNQRVDIIRTFENKKNVKIRNYRRTNDETYILFNVISVGFRVIVNAENSKNDAVF